MRDLQQSKANTSIWVSAKEIDCAAICVTWLGVESSRRCTDHALPERSVRPDTRVVRQSVADTVLQQLDWAMKFLLPRSLQAGSDDRNGVRVAAIDRRTG